MKNNGDDEDRGGGGVSIKFRTEEGDNETKWFREEIHRIYTETEPEIVQNYDKLYG